MGFTIRNGVLLKYTEERGVTEVVIPEGVKSIGGVPFIGYGDMTKQSIMKWLTADKDKPFKDCQSITRVIIPYSVTSIGESAFKGCTNLRYVFIPESVTCIGSSAFEGCGSLQRIYLPESITHIGVHAFSECRNLRQVNIPKGIRCMDLGVFSDCEQLTEAIIPEGVTEIRFGAFRGCKNLERVSIPESAVDIKGRILDDTPWMQRHTEEFVIINRVLIRYQGTDTTVVIPKEAVSVAEHTIPDCAGIEHVIIPEHVTSIYKGAFKRCDRLRKITLYGVSFYPAEMKEYDLYEAMEMLKTGDFEADVRPFVKYAAITGYWLKTKSIRAESYIQGHADEIFRFLINHGNPSIVRLLLDRRMIVHREHIDDLIGYTIEKNLLELRMELLHYKSEVLGYGDPAAQFKL